MIKEKIKKGLETAGKYKDFIQNAYEKEADGRTFKGEVAKHEKASGHGQSHKRETLYKSSLRKKQQPKKKQLMVTNEKDTGPTKLVKGPDGKMRRVKA